MVSAATNPSPASQTASVARVAGEPDPALVAQLAEFLDSARRLVVLSGAGCSTESGIPDYRDHDGGWKRSQPTQYREFVGDGRARQRYWARSLIGWERVAAARPNAAHAALAHLERCGRLHWLITQNVDGLHQKAGSRRVIDLHGRLDSVECLGCGTRLARSAFQEMLEALNPGWRVPGAQTAPDGDADLDGVDFDEFRIPACAACAGVLKPGVVFFGENVPRVRVDEAFARLAEADAFLVVGSSLMVWSGYRFARAAAAAGIPIAAVNLGRTRADALLTLKLSGSCGSLLPAVLAHLGT